MLYLHFILERGVFLALLVQVKIQLSHDESFLTVLKIGTVAPDGKIANE
jgi:hypothetical protein